MKPSRIIKTIAAMAFLAGAGPLFAAVTVDVDMDTATPGIQSSRTAAVNDTFSIALVMTADAAGVSSYFVSVNFDPIELTLNGAPASTELLPAGFTFNFNAGVNSESQALGQVLTFEAATFGLGPVSSSFTIGTIDYKVASVLNDGLADITPGLFNGGVDGIFDNASGDLGPGAVFNPGYVVPEPAGAMLLLMGTGFLCAARRRDSA
jgi:hypothetical protein